MNAPHPKDQQTKAATKMNVGLPQPPVFKTLAEERQHRKERLAAGFQAFRKVRISTRGSPVTSPRAIRSSPIPSG